MKTKYGAAIRQVGLQGSDVRVLIEFRLSFLPFPSFQWVSLCLLPTRIPL